MTTVNELVKLQLGTGYKYQQFGCDDVGLTPGVKVSKKMESWGDLLDDCVGMDVLDIGCNLGFFSFLAAERGASNVLGVDVDSIRLAWAMTFRDTVRDDLGHEWMSRVNFHTALDDIESYFDVIYMWSVYHHLYKLIPDHDHWFNWLDQILAPGGRILFEGPFTADDYVIKRLGIESAWSRDVIEEAMSRFNWEYRGPALHTGGRETVLLWR